MKKRLWAAVLAVMMAWSALALPAGAADTTGFSDVSDRNTALAVETLRLMGVLDGYGDGTFRPDRQLTRAQFCKMASYAVGAEDELGLYNTITVFPDVRPSHWAAGYINLPADVAVTFGETRVSLSSLFATDGYAACVRPLAAATGIAFDHVVVSSGDVVAEAASLAGSDSSALLRSASDFLKKIRTDMDATELLSLAGSIASVGVENITAFDAPMVTDVATDADGNLVETGLQAVDAVQLAITLGLLVPGA